ncbi:unnamed protein product [Adineta steineri]|uniref:Uncharacterized protein n=1 Tax=Adineta steineri TaxID=433720 RepID=A0A814NQF6_9BILA|nr:unnamed protein product [Adineta steineri]
MLKINSYYFIFLLFVSIYLFPRLQTTVINSRTNIFSMKRAQGKWSDPSTNDGTLCQYAGSKYLSSGHRCDLEISDEIN